MATIEIPDHLIPEGCEVDPRSVTRTGPETVQIRFRRKRESIGYKVLFKGDVRVMNCGETACRMEDLQGNRIATQRLGWGFPESDGWRPCTITELYEGDE